MQHYFRHYLSQRRPWILLCAGCFILYFIILLKQEYITDCSDDKVRLKIQSLCQRFNAGEGGGSICPDFCTDKITFDECFYLHHGKDVVFSAEHMSLGEKVMVKSLLVTPREGTEFKPSFGLKEYPSFAEFESMIKTFVKDNYDIVISSISDIWLDDREIKGVLTPHQMEIIWSLVNNNEYVLIKTFSNEGVFPELVGSCGSFYVVEKLIPLNYPTVFPRNLHFDDFVDRIKIASRLLELVDKLEKIHPEPLYLCDVKKEHLGTSFMTGAIKFLDLDSVFTKSILVQTVGNDTRCTKDSNCGFFDCKGKCGENGLCEYGVVTSNLNIICEKIFKNYNFIFNGLLPDTKHASKKIRHLLNECHVLNQSYVLPQLQKAFYDVIKFSIKKREL